MQTNFTVFYDNQIGLDPVWVRFGPVWPLALVHNLQLLRALGFATSSKRGRTAEHMKQTRFGSGLGPVWAGLVWPCYTDSSRKVFGLSGGIGAIWEEADYLEHCTVV